jgi:hypothetical protein
MTTTNSSRTPNTKQQHPDNNDIGAAGCFCCTNDSDRNNTPFRNDFGAGTTTASAATMMAHEDSIMHAQELNELSPQERERVSEEVHGVAKFPDETEELLAKCLEQFKEAVANVNVSKRRALDRALFYRPSILTDTSFHLLFLRADQYHPTKAAHRMAKYFGDKLALFGEDKLVKKIVLEDLNETDRKVLDTGFFMVLPNKDPTGRPIWFCDVTKFDFNKGISLVS